MLPRRKYVDPVLEKLRKEVDGPPNLDTLSLSIQRLCSKIHASYLFENEGKTTLQMLCLFLSSTASGKTYAGWQEFASHLSLTMEQIRCIDYDFKGIQDPTYYVLLAFVQMPEATLDTVLIALERMERYDVINRIKDCLHEFIDSVLRDSNVTQDNKKILRPKSLPKVPLVLSPLAELRGNDQDQAEKKVPSQHSSNSIAPGNEIKKESRTYGSTVMLTFSEDGWSTAENIAKIFRCKEPKIGVLMLREQEKYVFSKPHEFIENCFKQVNYVVPILTRGYIENIMNPNQGDYCLSSLDEKYAKFIYTLSKYEYMKSGCCNNRVRCVVPENQISLIANCDLHPTFEAWFPESDIDALANNILLRKI